MISCIHEKNEFQKLHHHPKYLIFNTKKYLAIFIPFSYIKLSSMLIFIQDVKYLNKINCNPCKKMK